MVGFANKLNVLLGKEVVEFLTLNEHLVHRLASLQYDLKRKEDQRQYENHDSHDLNEIRDIHDPIGTFHLKRLKTLYYDNMLCIVSIDPDTRPNPRECKEVSQGACDLRELRILFSRGVR